MLRKENEYRLGDTYLVEYAKSQKDGWKTKVTEDLQVRVVEEHQEEARNAGVYDNTRDGIKFLRAASGNYAHRIEEIKECANYVKYTHFCVRGPLKPGDYVDLTTFPLIHPDTEKRRIVIILERARKAFSYYRKFIHVTSIPGSNSSNS